MRRGSWALRSEKGLAFWALMLQLGPRFDSPIIKKFHVAVLHIHMRLKCTMRNTYSCRHLAIVYNNGRPWPCVNAWVLTSTLWDSWDIYWGGCKL